jgi:hypothetical protein
VQLLYNLGVTFDQHNDYGESALFTAVRYGRNAIIKTIFDIVPYNKKVSLMNSMMGTKTLFEYAVKFNQRWTLQILLHLYELIFRKPYDIYTCDRYGVNLQSVAVKWADWRMIQTLYEYGFTDVDHHINGPYNGCKTALHVAADCLTYHFKYSVERIKRNIDTLLMLGSTALTKLDGKYTPLHYAIQRRNSAITTHLWSHYSSRGILDKFEFYHKDLVTMKPDFMLLLFQLGLSTDVISANIEKWPKYWNLTPDQIRRNQIILSLIEPKEELTEEMETERYDIRYIAHFSTSFCHKLLQYLEPINVVCQQSDLPFKYKNNICRLKLKNK